MKTIFMAVLALAVGILVSCSESRTEGCLITHVNGVSLNPAVPLPANDESVAMNPGDSYRVWCAREIRDSSVGDVISEDRRILRIASLPTDAELEIRPNERDAVYRGHPVPSSANVWNGFQEASDSMTPTNWWGLAIPVAIVVAFVAIALYIWRRKGQESQSDAAIRF